MAGPTALTPAPTTTITAPTPLAVGVQLSPHFDVIELLPTGTPQDRLRLLRQHSLDLHAITVPYADLQAASAARTNAASALKRLTDHPQNGGANLPPEAPQVVSAQRALDRASDEFRRLKDRSEARAAAWQTSSQALANVENYLRAGIPGNCTLNAVEVALPKPARGEAGVLDQIENRRRQVRTLKATKHTIESAPHSSAWAKQKVRAEIEALASRGAIDPSNVVEHGGELVWPMTPLSSEVHGAQERGIAFAQVLDTAAVFAWLHRDALLAAIDKEVMACADDKAALPDDEREVRLAQVEADMLATERDEAELVMAAQAQGLSCDHRPDCNPLAILSCALITRPNGGHMPETTDGYSYNLIGGGRRRR